MNLSSKFLFFIALVINLSSGLPANCMVRASTKVRGKCTLCNYYYQTGDTPYTVLKSFSRMTLDLNLGLRDGLLLNGYDLKNAEIGFLDYCDKHCRNVRDRALRAKTDFIDSNGANNQSLGAEPQAASASGISNYDDSEGGGKGTDLATGSGATLIGAGLNGGEVSGGVDKNEQDDVAITTAQTSGYVSGAATNQGGIVSSSTGFNESDKNLVGILGGGSAIGLVSQSNELSHGTVSSSALNGTSSVSLPTKAGSSGGAASSSGSGVIASTSGNSSPSLSLIGEKGGGSGTGVSTAAEAAGMALSDNKTVATSTASNGGTGTVGGVSGQAVLGKTLTNTTISNMVMSGPGSALAIGNTAGSSSSSNDSIATAVSAMSGAAIGKSPTGSGSAGSTISDKSVVASASSQGEGMATSVVSGGKGIAGSSRSNKPSLVMPVSNEYGSATGTSGGKGASVGTSAGKVAKTAHSSFKRKKELRQQPSVLDQYLQLFENLENPSF